MDQDYQFPILPIEMIIEIADRSTASTKSKIPCLNRQFYRLYLVEAHRSAIEVRKRIRETMWIHITDERIHPNPFNVDANYTVLPNNQLDGEYVEYYTKRQTRVRDNRRTQVSIRRIYGCYLNGVKHGKFTTLTQAGGVILLSYYNYGKPYGLWRANYYDIPLPAGLPAYGKNNKRLSYREKVWYDIDRKISITWIMQSYNVISVKITKNISLQEMFERLYSYRITAYEFRQIRQSCIPLPIR